VAVDLVNLFRAAERCPAHAAEARALSPLPLAFWMQEGIRSPEAAAILEGSGIRVIEDRCLKTELQRLLG